MKYVVETLTRETGILGRITRLQGFDNVQEKLRAEHAVSQAVNGTAKMISWRWGSGIRLFSHDEIYATFEIETSKDMEFVKQAVVAGLKSYWGMAPVSVAVTNIRVVSAFEDISSGVFKEPIVQYMILGFGSGLTIGLVAFG